MFTIHFSSELDVNSSSNSYGYYIGKTGVTGGDVYPHTISDKRSQYVKWYSSYKIADNAAMKIGDKCSYVVAYKIEEW